MNIMGSIERFGVSVEGGLLGKFDTAIGERGYKNRSEAIRDLMRTYVLDLRTDAGCDEVIGTITLVYDHHTPGTGAGLTALQHAYGRKILSNIHVHISHAYCLEVIVVKGIPKELSILADKLGSLRGVHFGRLVVAALAETAD
jgi:CopG family nickel-responsive transcriptional regulator